MKPILLMIVATMLVGFHAKESLACWCRREVVATDDQLRRSVAKEVDRSAAVFVGEIIEQTIDTMRALHFLQRSGRRRDVSCYP